MSYMSYERMNALGQWIARSRYTREEFAKEMGVSYQLLLCWCGKNGVGKAHAEKVSKATGIPVDRLVVHKEPAIKPDKPLKWGGCWVE